VRHNCPALARLPAGADAPPCALAQVCRSCWSRRSAPRCWWWIPRTPRPPQPRRKPWCAPKIDTPRCLRLLTRAAHLRRAQSISDAIGLVTTGVVLATAVFGAVAYLMDKSTDGLKADVKTLKADVKSLDRTSMLTPVVSLLTLATVVYMAVAAPAPMR
jgi:hypothetical protein